METSCPSSRSRWISGSLKAMRMSSMFSLNVSPATSTFEPMVLFTVHSTRRWLERSAVIQTLWRSERSGTSCMAYSKMIVLAETIPAHWARTSDCVPVIVRIRRFNHVDHIDPHR